MTLFDQGAERVDHAGSALDDARSARDAAIEVVADNANSEWLDHATSIVESLSPGTEFTTDLVWERLASQRDVPLSTHEPRALGAVMQRLGRLDVIRKTGQYQPSARRECHARPIPVWQRTTKGHWFDA